MLVVRFVSFAVCTAHSHHPALRYLPRLCLLSSRKVIRIHIDYANNRGRGHPNPTVHFIFEFWRNALFLYPSIHPSTCTLPDRVSFQNIGGRYRCGEGLHNCLDLYRSIDRRTVVRRIHFDLYPCVRQSVVLPREPAAGFQNEITRASRESHCG